MEEKKQMVIGMDLAEDYLQISYLYLNEMKPVTLRPGGVEEYNIPMCLSKRHGMNQWFFGKEALKHAGEGKGILIEDLFNLAKKGETITLEEKEISGEELFFLYMKKCYSLLNFIIGGNEIASLMITVESLKDESVTLLKKIREKLPLDNSRIFFGDRQECLYYYVLNQPEELWHYQVAVFDFTKDTLKSYTFSRNIHTTPIVAVVERNDYETMKVRKEFAGPEEKADYERKLDEDFLDILTAYVDGKLLSSVYFIGEGFFGGWYEKSLRFLCKSRRVFEGNNLYSKGACFGAKERVRKSEAGSTHIFLGEEKLKINVGMMVKKAGNISYYPLLDGGENWYEAKHTVELMIDGNCCLNFLITPLEGGIKKEVIMSLEGLETLISMESRIKLEVTMNSQWEIHAYVEDMGFGDFRHSSGMSFQKTFTLQDGKEPRMESGVFLCIGSYGTKPFRFHKINKGIFSMEELCYYLCRNVHLLDRDIMTEELINWIDEQCGMEELSRKLRELLHFGGSLAAFVSIILEECYYKEPEEIKKLSLILKENENLSIYERKKNRADYLLKEEKYMLAIEEYGKLYGEIAGRDSMLESRILHNLACAYGSLFFFEMAADCFKQAYDNTEEKEELRCFLLCKRMALSKKEYVEFTSKDESYYEAALELEKELEQVEEAWTKAGERKQTEMVLAPKEDKNTYYQEMAKLLEKWKEEYLDKVLT